MKGSQNHRLIDLLKRAPWVVFNILVVIYLLIPLIVVVWTSFGAEVFPRFPPQSYSLKWYQSFFQKEHFIDSLWLSVYVAFCTMIIALIIGIPVSIALVRHKFRGSTVLNTLCMSPILFPAVVIGIALLVFYSRVRLSHTFISLVGAHVILAIPFVIRLVTASLYGLDHYLEEASLNLGVNRLKTFFKITLPLIKPGVIAGGLFAFLISFDEITVTLFLAGARLKTLPIRIYTHVEYSADPTISAVSAFLIVVALALGVPVAWRFFGIKR